MAYNLTLWTLSTYINETNEVFLIELNAFGAEFSAASCLEGQFHSGES